MALSQQTRLHFVLSDSSQETGKDKTLDQQNAYQNTIEYVRGRSKRVYSSFLNAFLFYAVTLFIALSLISFPSQVATAKTVAEYDAEIVAQQKVVEEKELLAQQAKQALTDTAMWYYKNVDRNDMLDMILNDSGFDEAMDRVSYIEKVYELYVQKKDETEHACKAEKDAKKKLERLRQDKVAREEALAKACSVQFPQGNDQPWSSIPYWTGTIASSGCGICAYTTVIDVLCGKSYTPADMMRIRGDWKGMDGYPNNGTGVKHGKTHKGFTQEQFDIATFNISPSVESLKKALKQNESAAIVCSRGRAFKNNIGEWRYSSGHFVAVLAHDEKGFHVSDSAYDHEKGTNVIYSDEEMATMLKNANHLTIYSN